MFLHRSLLHMSLSPFVTTACDKTTRKDLSKGLKVLSGMRIMRDALISVMREKEGNRNISRKKKKPNKYQHLLFTVLFQKVSEKPNPKEHHLVQELHFRTDNYFQLGCFPGLICRKTTPRLQSHTAGAWPRVLLGVAIEKCRNSLGRGFWSLPKYLLSAPMF